MSDWPTSQMAKVSGTAGAGAERRVGMQPLLVPPVPTSEGTPKTTSKGAKWRRKLPMHMSPMASPAPGTVLLESWRLHQTEGPGGFSG